jgi:hypothetical protein
MVKGVVNGVVMFYPGRHYNKEVNGSTTTVQKFYAMGSVTIAVRTISGGQDTLKWILSYHLVSASVTATHRGHFVRLRLTQ